MPINVRLDRKSLSLGLLSACSLTLIIPAIFPQWHLLFFAPFLVILYYQKSYLFCLWAAFLCGLAIDILSAEMRMGLHAIAYCMTTWLLYDRRRHFFADSFSTLPIMTFLFCMSANIMMWTSVNIFERSVGISWSWVEAQLIYQPLLTAVFAVVWQVNIGRGLKQLFS